MSIPQTNFENNNKMSELTKNINDIFGYILLYSVIIFTALSALLGGIVVYPVYGVIYIFNKIREHCCANEVEADVNLENEITTNEVTNEVEPDKKPLIDENWCNISVKNIINFESEVEEDEDVSNAEDEVELEVEEEVLSIRRPSEEELRQFQKEEEEDASEADANEIVNNSPNDKYSIGHYKSKTYINDPLDFDN
jgi:hypothetical protein